MLQVCQRSSLPHIDPPSGRENPLLVLFSATPEVQLSDSSLCRVVRVKRVHGLRSLLKHVMKRVTLGWIRDGLLVIVFEWYCTVFKWRYQLIVIVNLITEIPMRRYGEICLKRQRER